MQAIRTVYLQSDRRVNSQQPAQETSMETLYLHRMLLDQCRAPWVDSLRKVAGIRVFHLRQDNTIETTRSLRKEGADMALPEDEEGILHEAGAMVPEVDTQDHKDHQDHRKATEEEVDTIRGAAIPAAEEEDLLWMVWLQLEQV
jgi:hypothetical protein